MTFSVRETAVKLYSYFRSSAAFRTRIALNLKGLPYDTVPVHLGGGEHLRPQFAAVNPQKRVPALALDNGEMLLQSLAIVEYLDEVHPDPPLLPKDAVERAKVRAVAQIISCDIHPLNNSGTLNYLRGTVKVDEATLNDWYRHWITVGFEAVEALIRPAPYAFGSAVTIADLCIVPQVFNAHRFKVPLDRFPAIVAAAAAASALPAFDAARPERQPDAE
ncbi:MAG: maleylacetoacetate isomerase [Bradyrhizobiaceae bacterium]|nr:maleylacetoacetate isomerase [Bradyrhizobiaceae bacterium]